MRHHFLLILILLGLMLNGCTDVAGNVACTMYGQGCPGGTRRTNS
jgi:hypothetical protein